MLSNTISIKIDKFFNIKDFAQFLKDFSLDKKLAFAIDGDLENYIDDYHDYDIKTFISKLNQNNFEIIQLQKEEISKLKKETCQELDFSESALYIINHSKDSIEDIEKFMKLDFLSFACLILEENKITHVFFYMEDVDNMAVVVDYDSKSNFEQFLLKKLIKKSVSHQYEYVNKR